MKLVPLTKDEPRRPRIPEFEESETLLVLEPGPNIEILENKRRADNERIMKDFLEGKKSKRLRKLNADDHR